MTLSYISELQAFLKEKQIITDPVLTQKLSRDCYWYSPILDEELKDMKADAVVIPENLEEIEQIFAIAFEHKQPVLFKGSATGNYGQIVPLQGGILIDTKLLNKIIEINPGEVRVEPGVKIGMLEKTLRENGQELCIFPSTYLKATAGGFVSGGSGGIGSITWGNLWDGNVIELTILTMEEKPNKLTISGDELLNYIHSYGTTGFIAEIVFRTSEKTEWIQQIISFENLDDSLRFSEKLAYASSIQKRSVSTCEWPIPSYFKPLSKFIQEGKHVVIIEINEEASDELQRLVEEWNGEVTYTILAEKYHKGLTLSDYTWNHTTLWALNANEQMTYLQASFDLNRYIEQVALIQEQFKDEFYQHFDWMRMDGKVVPQSIPLVRFSTKERLDEMVRFCESIGIKIFNPHTYLLEAGGWEAHISSVLRTKGKNDPRALLNPGKIRVTLSEIVN
ncbi:FAD-binding oxidoreductase [Neobacillus sp. NPDC097160]|uniref:FAD-binding oxidoreductase n=1 Tax=Neobacillus sp. NPDC097160 TaxID=3364298 RepID=UPI003803302F